MLTYLTCLHGSEVAAVKTSGAVRACHPYRARSDHISSERPMGQGPPGSIARAGSKTRTVHEIVVSQCHVIAPVRRGNKAAESAVGKDAANRSTSTGAGVENDWPVAG